MEIKNPISNFFFRPASAFPLAVLRLSVAAILLVQAFLIFPDLHELYGSNGIFPRAISDYFAHDVLPGVGWFLERTASLGVSEEVRLAVLYGVYVISLIFLLFGLFTPIASIVAWFTHIILMGAHFSSYGVDQFAHVFLFFFIWMPVGKRYSLDVKLVGVSTLPTEWARFSLRVVQVQLCIVYFASGLEKAMGEQWWNGEAIWRSLMLPVYYHFDFSWISRFPLLAKLGTWGTLIVEMGYPFFIWSHRTRRFWVAATIALHLGIGVFLGLHTFSALMAVLTLSAFGFSAEPSKDSNARGGS